MLRKIFLVVGLAAIGLGTAYGLDSFSSQQEATSAPCRCCGDQCTCVDCVCDEMGCQCDTGGPCFCSDGCGAACCDE